MGKNPQPRPMKKASLSTPRADKPSMAPAPRIRKARNGAGNGNATAVETVHDVDAAQILGALVAIKKGDFTARLPLTWSGTSARVADAFNEVAELMETSTQDLNRISRLVGREGRINQRLTTGNVTGAWAERVESVNTLINCLVHPISET